jgi:DNA repair exonuclease SbcCD ATPase subunit
MEPPHIVKAAPRLASEKRQRNIKTAPLYRLRKGKSSMVINKIELTNFKGLTGCFEFNGHNVAIYGDNATGKTTLKDAFIWLLTGKDSQGRSDYNIKTLDKYGEAIPMLDHKVNAILSIDGEIVELTRNYKEVWQKKTGTNVQQFNGHKTEYHINGVPKSEKEYTAYIETIAPMKLVYLLTMTGYFNEQIKAEDRRKMLLDMCGDVNEAAMLDSPEWAALSKYTSRTISVSELKKMKTAQKAKINEDIKAIPTQINVHRGYMNVGSLDEAAEKAAVSRLAAEIEAKESTLRALSNGEALSQLRRELADLEADKIRFASAQEKALQEKTKELRQQLRENNTKVNALENSLATAKQKQLTAQTALRRAEENRNDALSRYEKLEAQEFKGDTVCPTCGQDLPEGKLAEALGNFNENKAKQLEKIVTEGKGYASQIETAKADLKAAEEKIAGLVAEKETAVKHSMSIQADIDAIEAKPAQVFDESLIENKKLEIVSLTSLSAAAADPIRAEIEKLKLEKAEHERNISKLDAAKDAAQSITDLQAKEKKLAGEFEECEYIISLCDNFNTARVKALDEKISGAFRTAKFKLTETLVNGGTKDVCETLVNGVPYSSANNAARINVGLDIIQTFSEYYNVRLPVFVDNAESVTHLEAISAQLIMLIVSEPDKTLRMEIK